MLYYNIRDQNIPAQNISYTPVSGIYPRYFKAGILSHKYCLKYFVWDILGKTNFLV